MEIVPALRETREKIRLNGDCRNDNSIKTPAFFEDMSTFGLALEMLPDGWVVNPLHRLFGAEVNGIDLDDGKPLHIEKMAYLIDKFGVVLVRDVVCDDAGLARFAACFGPLQNMSGAAGHRQHVIGVSNVAEDGSILSADQASRLQHEANKLWHTDSSFLSPGATYSFLLARLILTTAGGQTEFCDMRAAWDALPPGRQSTLTPLKTDHSIRHSWRLVGVDMPHLPPSALPPVTRKLVPDHRPTGRKALMIPSHVERIENLDRAQTQILLAELIEFATAPERIYRHHWRAGDLLIWDNRCMLHRVTPFDQRREARDLRSCRVIDREDETIT